MILTGKTKDNFLEYLEKDYCFKHKSEKWFKALNEVFQHALIIEFFESVGITVDVIPILNNPIKWMPNPFWIEKGISTDDAEYYETRPEATIEAIKKANEIYNAN